jgi:hypothetical protein
MPVTPDLLREAGELLYGDRWQSALAEAIEVHPRTMRHWASGAREMPLGAWQDVLAAVRERYALTHHWLSRFSPVAQEK